MSSDNAYFSDREHGPRPRALEVIPAPVWWALWAIIENLINRGYFGDEFPEPCQLDKAVCGTNDRRFYDVLRGKVPDLGYPRDFPSSGDEFVPQTLAILDLVEFCYRCVAAPSVICYHKFLRHDHFRFDREKGRHEFRIDVNELFARNSIAFELDGDGRVYRTGPDAIGEIVRAAVFKTGDSDLDALLQAARDRFLRPSVEERKIGLEKLWDAYERIKTLENADKKKGATAILDKAATGPVLRDAIEADSKALTDAGNKLAIRHHENGTEAITDAEHIDYLFTRLYGLVTLLLRRSGRI